MKQKSKLFNRNVVFKIIDDEYIRIPVTQKKSLRGRPMGELIQLNWARVWCEKIIAARRSNVVVVVVVKHELIESM